MTTVPVTRTDIEQTIHTLGLSGGPVCVHSSLRSFGPIAGGADSVIDGLLDADCTVLVPTFSDVFHIAPPMTMRPSRNGRDYAMPNETPGADIIFTPDTKEMNADMGALPATLLQRPGRQRGNHPLDSFAAVGPLAAELIAEQGPRDVYAPLRALAKRDGWVLLMGVGLTRMTILHLAEQTAGRNLFLRWANDPDGQPMYAEIGSCSEGFDVFEPLLAPLAYEARVGVSRWSAYRAAEVVATAADAIRANPRMTHCANPTCLVCRDAVLGGPITP